MKMGLKQCKIAGRNDKDLAGKKNRHTVLTHFNMLMMQCLFLAITLCILFALCNNLLVVVSVTFLEQF